MRGHAVHAKVDDAGSASDDGVRIEYSLPLFSDALGLIGKADVVEFLFDGTPYPVEYKHGTRAARVHDEVQLAAQAMCLEEMTNLRVDRGAIFHFSSRHRREVVITDELREITRNIIVEVRGMLRSMRLPPPVNDNRCRNCSLIDLCQPNIIASGERRHKIETQLFTGDEE
jgi:CRISPR-associated exonuclease Cas4